MTTLTTLNELRTAANMKPLKAWKESKAKLLLAIEKLAATQKPDLHAKSVANAIANDSELAMKAKVKKMYAPKKSATEKAVRNVNTIAQLAKQLNIDPKQARAKVRRHKPTFIVDHHYTTADEKKVIEFLTTDTRKK